MTQQQPQYRKPAPRPADAITDVFWEHCKQGELIIPYCPKCAEYFWYPRQFCPNCLLPDWEWRKVSGKGKVYTYTLVRQPGNPAFADDVPYPYCIIQLDEGPRLISNVVGIDPLEVKCEMRVEVTFEKMNEDVSLFKFRPVQDTEAVGRGAPEWG